VSGAPGAPGAMTRGAAAAVAFCAGLLAGATGCAHHTAEGPGATVGAFGAALARGDYRGAYALTSSDFRTRVSFEAFAAPLLADPAGTKALGQALDTEAAHVQPRVEVDSEAAGAVPLVVEDGRWRIDGPAAVELWGQSTPRSALRSFVRALDQRRYDIVLRLVPNRYRGGLTADALRIYWEEQRKEDGRALLARLRAALEAPITETGDEARMPYGNGAPGEVRFLREDGRWKIDSPQ